ncbi:sigma-70 family RNA polymerase sigma factor [Flagellimonas hymeniacidonis]|uniref:Sigma-70 family RNA polymerase sigma factor n=1 Tax=Flagellimonas hymeniacidonis TaxID=2603628 RepID=A0A5C8V7W4_9FLAO|nr:sigma-70 family RNA polymerase sigma factor [Flagellimonas hymeniacidonis]TXN37473.1 sigma-70 family RNA polymerase sigma factor [Flagellimonas hymeniacidonis]
MTQNNLTNTIDHLFRNEYGKVVAVLTNKFGVSNLELIEDAAQDTFLKAMKIWGYKSIPDNPTAWLYRVANNALIDVLRRNKKMDFFGSDYIELNGEDATEREQTLDDTISDSQLKMIFACCHPTLSQEYQIILSLKLIGGFSNKELAEALLKKEETVAKSFTRAKKKFREEVAFLQIPVQMGLQSRLFMVLQVVYLLFTEGYAATTGSQVLKRDICYEALRLALLLRENKYCKHPDLEALIALMCFHASRFDARLNDEGELVTLENQDRSKYNQELIQIGIRHLENSGTEDKLPSSYHLEAARSYYHCVAKTFEKTDWKSILHLYNLQLQRQYSPMLALNQIVPFAKVNGAKKGLAALNDLQEKTDFKNSGLFYAIKAALLLETNNKDEYKSTLKKAIELTENELIKKHLSKKLSV